MAAISGDIKTSRDVFYKSVYLNKDKLASEINKFDTAMRDFMVKIAAVVRNQQALQQNPSLNKDKLEQRGICRYSMLTNTFEIYCADNPYGQSRLEEISKSHCKQQLDFSFGYGKQEMVPFLTAKVMKELSKPGSWQKLIDKVHYSGFNSAEEKMIKSATDAEFEGLEKSIEGSRQDLVTRVAILIKNPKNIGSFIQHLGEIKTDTGAKIPGYALRKLKDEIAWELLRNTFDKK